MNQSNQSMVPLQDATAIARTTNENVATVLAEQAKAEIQARYTVAVNYPRNMSQVRTELLADCQRSAVAEQAFYHLKFGKTEVRNFSVRFAETVWTRMSNIDVKAEVVFDDEKQRMIRVTVVDLERNNSFPNTTMIEKTVERSYLKNGQTAISVRENSDGRPVYLVAATEQEMLQKTNSAVSKCLRGGILRMLPADIKEECWHALDRTLSGQIKADPDAYKKKLFDSFASIGVSPTEIEKYLQHGIDTISPEEIKELRNAYAAVRDGDETWNGLLNNKLIIDEKAPETPEEPQDEQDALDALADEIAASMQT